MLKSVEIKGGAFYTETFPEAFTRRLASMLLVEAARIFRQKRRDVRCLSSGMPTSTGLARSITNWSEQPNSKHKVKLYDSSRCLIPAIRVDGSIPECSLHQ